MSDTLEVKLTNTNDIDLLFTTLTHLEKRSGYHFTALKQALDELIENILQHAYHAEKNTPIEIIATFVLKQCQLQIRIQEYGEPFDFTPYLSEPIDQTSDHSKGFYHIYDLVDTFYFTSLGKKGKQFTLISALANCQLQPSTTELEGQKRTTPSIDSIMIRTFQAGDEEAISRLIYQNYDYTYYKPFFYEPSGIKTANSSGAVHSVIAEYEHTVIGHFALVPHIDTNSAEVAIAVVHPLYKGIGIMNRMFVKLIEHAKESAYRSIFGEAIMLHPYSQKANIKKGMKESALVLGLVPDDIEIEHNLKIEKRSGVLLGYLLFNSEHYRWNIPNEYRQWIEKTSQQFEIHFSDKTPNEERAAITIHIDSELNLGAIEINIDIDAHELTATIEKLMLEQTDMIYTDINLHRITNIDILVQQLNEHGFFYSGVLFDFYHNEDYLRLQKVCSKSIDTEHLVTYSSFSKQLLDYIRKDKKRISLIK